jgi:predicted GH43/DUF377 family glycosyl hydrolase
MDPVPSVTQQGVPVKPLLSAYHTYNSGTADGKRYCCRGYDPVQKRSRLIWQRRIDNELIREEPLEIVGRGSFEDGRIFLHNGRHWVAFTEGFYERTPYIAVQQIARLGEDWQPEEKITIPYGANGGGRKSEKNWQFFSYEGRLHFIYSIVPHLVVELGTDMKPSKEYRTGEALYWPWGEVLRGGTPPIRLGDNFITFFHSHTEHRQADRRYAMGAYAFEARPPFQIVSISPALLRASDQDMIMPNPSVPNWNPLVVFPMGAWEGNTPEHPQDYDLNVSLGVNDSFDAIAGFDAIAFQPTQLYAQPKTRYFQCENGPLPLMKKGQVIHWKLRRLKAPFNPQKGYMATANPDIIALIEARRDTKEITERVFNDYEQGR